MRKIIFTALFILLPFGIFAQELSQRISSTRADLSEVFRHAETIDFLRSLLIQQNGEMIGERYFGKATPDYPYNIKSASKSLISMLIGIAIQKDYIESVDEPILTFFPNYFEENPDSIKATITIRNLLTMQTGLETTSRENYGPWIASDNWTEFVLNQPMKDKPDGEMAYSTGVSHLLSAIITEASGMSTREFAEKYLFAPLNIRVGDWERDPQGYYMGGNNVALIPADMIKIGQMILNTGLYEGDRVLPQNWIKESFKTYTTSPINSYNYGYMWWNRTMAGHRVYFAWGFGGQFIFIIPQLDSVVVVTSNIDPTDHDREYQHPIFDLLEHQVIPLLSNYPPVYK
ncbi:MAG: serine hydrolase [Balneolaceae bacterium]